MGGKVAISTVSQQARYADQILDLTLHGLYDPPASRDD